MKLTKSNYYSKKASMEYFSASQYKDFEKCPAMAMAKLKDEWQPDKTKALTLGSYVDEVLTGTPGSLSRFLEANKDEIFKVRGGKYAEYEKADAAIAQIRNQPLMMHYLSGKHQVIMEGEIEGVPVKIRMDSYKPGEFIADLKYMASLRSPNLFEPMVKYWGYDIQAAIYQEIVKQNTGRKLPFYLVVATKETPVHLAVGEVNKWNLEDALNRVRANIKGFQAIKQGVAPAERCEAYECQFCTTTHTIKEPVDTDLFGYSAAQLKAMKGE